MKGQCEMTENYMLRFHNKPWKAFFTPLDVKAPEQLTDVSLQHLLVAQVAFEDGASFSADASWTSPALAHRAMAKPWTGARCTVFDVWCTTYLGTLQFQPLSVQTFSCFRRQLRRDASFYHAPAVAMGTSEFEAHVAALGRDVAFGQRIDALAEELAAHYGVDVARVQWERPGECRPIVRRAARYRASGASGVGCVRVRRSAASRTTRIGARWTRAPPRIDPRSTRKRRRIAPPDRARIDKSTPGRP